MDAQMQVSPPRELTMGVREGQVLVGLGTHPERRVPEDLLNQDRLPPRRR